MPTTPHQLSVSLTPDFSRFIQKTVKSGRYADASEVIRDALRRLEEDEKSQEQPLVDPLDAADFVRQGVADIDVAQNSSPEMASELLWKFFEAFRLLGSAPLVGVAVPQIGPSGTRRFPIGNYLIYYRSGRVRL